MTAAEVRAWRLSHGWTQRKAAEMLSMPLATYKQREYGLRKVPGIMMLGMQCLDMLCPI